MGQQVSWLGDLSWLSKVSWLSKELIREVISSHQYASGAR